jgi:hypothetical protein
MNEPGARQSVREEWIQWNIRANFHGIEGSIFKLGKARLHHEAPFRIYSFEGLETPWAK